MTHETSRTIAAWAEETFGPARPEALVDRAATELAELAESLASADAKAITSEAADVAILLHRLAHLHGWDLTAAVDAKMARNRARIWEQSGDGTGRHLTEAPDADVSTARGLDGS
ncbi:MAG TPA: dATP/dGTP pyrophosphohydrolase domain-containing protein [Saliniramus sp.]|nr:dATP/dGTP pyrophosphohydrolase domain-containing protein [Saliniramus sp.]